MIITPIVKIPQTKKINIRLIILLVIFAVMSVFAIYLWVFYDNSVIEDDDWYYEELTLDGDGSPHYPYEIQTAEDLGEISEKVRRGSSYYEKYFVLMNDIDMTEYLSENGEGYNNGAGFMPIGSFSGTPFSGTLDGQGYRISGLWMRRSREESVGLFGKLSNAQIYRLNVIAEEYIVGKYSAGALAGYMENSVVTHCTAYANYLNAHGTDRTNTIGVLVGAATGSLIERCTASGDFGSPCSSNTAVGGLVGGAEKDVVIKSCSAEVNIYVSSGVTIPIMAGGLVGSATDNVIIDSCYSKGFVRVSSRRGNVGGFVGHMHGGEIKNSYAESDVSGGWSTGGFAGWVESSEIKNCYSAGEVGGSREYSQIGGFSGTFINVDVANCYAAVDLTAVEKKSYLSSSDAGGFYGNGQSRVVIESCYFDEEVAGTWYEASTGSYATSSAGYAERKTTQEMQTIETYEGWDFISTWYMPENDYPKLNLNL